jgi:hypothetical protein
VRFSEEKRYAVFHHKRNEEIWKELKVAPVEEKVRDTNQIGYNM